MSRLTRRAAMGLGATIVLPFACGSPTRAADVTFGLITINQQALFFNQ
jgi:hypothetical protein